MLETMDSYKTRKRFLFSLSIALLIFTVAIERVNATAEKGDEDGKQSSTSQSILDTLEDEIEEAKEKVVETYEVLDHVSQELSHELQKQHKPSTTAEKVAEYLLSGANSKAKPNIEEQLTPSSGVAQLEAVPVGERGEASMAQAALKPAINGISAGTERKQGHFKLPTSITSFGLRGKKSSSPKEGSKAAANETPKQNQDIKNVISHIDKYEDNKYDVRNYVPSKIEMPNLKPSTGFVDKWFGGKQVEQPDKTTGREEIPSDLGNQQASPTSPAVSDANDLQMATDGNRKSLIPNSPISMPNLNFGSIRQAIGGKLSNGAAKTPTPSSEQPIQQEPADDSSPRSPTSAEPKSASLEGAKDIGGFLKNPMPSMANIKTPDLMKKADSWFGRKKGPEQSQQSEVGESGDSADAVEVPEAVNSDQEGEKGKEGGSKSDSYQPTNRFSMPSLRTPGLAKGAGSWFGSKTKSSDKDSSEAKQDSIMPAEEENKPAIGLEDQKKSPKFSHYLPKNPLSKLKPVKNPEMIDKASRLIDSKLPASSSEDIDSPAPALELNADKSHESTSPPEAEGSIQQEEKAAYSMPKLQVPKLQNPVNSAGKWLGSKFGRQEGGLNAANSEVSEQAASATEPVDSAKASKGFKSYMPNFPGSGLTSKWFKGSKASPASQLGDVQQEQASQVHPNDAVPDADPVHTVISQDQRGQDSDSDYEDALGCDLDSESESEDDKGNDLTREASRIESNNNGSSETDEGEVEGIDDELAAAEDAHADPSDLLDADSADWLDGPEPLNPVFNDEEEEHANEKEKSIDDSPNSTIEAQKIPDKSTAGSSKKIAEPMMSSERRSAPIKEALERARIGLAVRDNHLKGSKLGAAGPSANGKQVHEAAKLTNIFAPPKPIHSASSLAAKRRSEQMFRSGSQFVDNNNNNKPLETHENEAAAFQFQPGSQAAPIVGPKFELKPLQQQQNVPTFNPSSSYSNHKSKNRAKHWSRRGFGKVKQLAHRIRDSSFVQAVVRKAKYHGAPLVHKTIAQGKEVLQTIDEGIENHRKRKRERDEYERMLEGGYGSGSANRKLEFTLPYEKALPDRLGHYPETPALPLQMPGKQKVSSRLWRRH